MIPKPKLAHLLIPANIGDVARALKTSCCLIVATEAAEASQSRGEMIKRVILEARCSYHIQIIAGAKNYDDLPFRHIEGDVQIAFANVVIARKEVP